LFSSPADLSEGSDNDDVEVVYIREEQCVSDNEDVDSDCSNDIDWLTEYDEDAEYNSDDSNDSNNSNDIDDSKVSMISHCDVAAALIKTCHAKRKTRKETRDLIVAMDYWHAVTQYNTNTNKHKNVLNIHAVSKLSRVNLNMKVIEKDFKLKRHCAYNTISWN